MWKTRFEVNTHNSNGLTRHRSSSSPKPHHYYSVQLPTVPRVREDSPSAVVRPSPPSSMPNLEILTEEDEDIPCSNLTNNEQPSLALTTLRKQNSYQTMNKYQIVLPTIIESNDHEIMIDNEQNKTESMDDKHNKYIIKLKQQDSFVATNTNYNQVMNVNVERKEQILNTNKNNKMIGFTLDKRINELLQQKHQRQNKSTSSDVDKTDILLPTTFKDISAFFENKSLAASTANISEQKKMVRARRSLLLNKHIPINNNDLPKLEIISSTEKESTIFHHQIKRIKTTHKFDSIDESELIINNSIAERSINFDNTIKTIESKVINNISLKQTLLKRWFIFSLLTITMFVYFYLSNLTNISKDAFQLNPFIYPQNSPSNIFPQQSKEAIPLINKNLIFQYGQFVRNCFFSSFDFLITFISQIFFRIDKYEYKNNIVYVATSTYEHLFD